MNRPVLKVALANATRWNSLLDMLLRFNEMKDVLVFITDDRLSNYNWEKSKKICSFIKPLKECEFELKKSDAGPGVAIKVFRFINHVARNEAAMTSSVRSVLSKWIDGNAIANGLCHKSGEFFDDIRELKLKENSNQIPSVDHGYVESPSIMSFAELYREKADEQFDRCPISSLFVEYFNFQSICL